MMACANAAVTAALHRYKRTVSKGGGNTAKAIDRTASELTSIPPQTLLTVRARVTKED